MLKIVPCRLCWDSPLLVLAAVIFKVPLPAFTDALLLPLTVLPEIFTPCFAPINKSPLAIKEVACKFSRVRVWPSSAPPARPPQYLNLSSTVLLVLVLVVPKFTLFELTTALPFTAIFEPIAEIVPSVAFKPKSPPALISVAVNVWVTLALEALPVFNLPLSLRTSTSLSVLLVVTLPVKFTPFAPLNLTSWPAFKAVPCKFRLPEALTDALPATLISVRWTVWVSAASVFWLCHKPL